MFLKVIKNCLEKSFIVAFAVFVTTLILPNHALSQTECDIECQQNLAQVRRATAKYHRVEEAVADGYVSTVDCVSSPDGGMGIHYIKPFLASNLTLDVTQPELLLYEPMKNGKLRLVGVEYFVPVIVNGVGPWFGSTAPPEGQYNQAPELYGQTFDGPMPGHNTGMPWHYDLHVWVWKHNPSGMFADFNPTVQCSQ
ncbi:MAG: hypothetical protein WKF71_18380 [Pyrinomonadaceae bacterium]